MKVKLALWILSVLLGEMTYPAGAQVNLDNHLAGPSRAEGAASVAGWHSLPYGLTFEARVAYQRAIEAVYWRHRIWPKENRAAKPALAEVMPEAALRAKVEEYLRKSQALAEYWQRPLSGEQLQAELERMARETKKPERLRELWAALGNDPYVIAECLARPALVDRLIQSWYAGDERKRASMQDDFASWGAGVQDTLSGTVDSPRAAYRLPAITGQSGGCVDNTWTAFQPDPPSARLYNSAVWTGTEMIIWGGNSMPPDSPSLLYTGGRYNPATDSWAATSLANAPSARSFHTAVWTGTEMIVWGGGAGLSTGGRYNPLTNTWVATQSAPGGRAEHTAVWTGTEMIVWGGRDGGVLNSGLRYNPVTDRWSTTRQAGTPSARSSHTAVWTGKEMIVWGGYNGSSFFNTGGRYDPAADTWLATSTEGAPSAREYHTAVWTDKEMIVWGGWPSLDNTGGRYDPETNTWVATNTTGAPSARQWHTAVWTGAEMIVWGGSGGGGWLNTGGRYDPYADTWVAISMEGAPIARSEHTVVWTGKEMIVWGGNRGGNSGGRYDPDTDTWVATRANMAPTGRSRHTVVWTGAEMIVWGEHTSIPMDAPTISIPEAATIRPRIAGRPPAAPPRAPESITRRSGPGRK